MQACPCSKVVVLSLKCTFLVRALQRISRHRTCEASAIILAVAQLAKNFAGESQRPDINRIVASGLFEQLVCTVAAVATAGTESLHDINHETLYQTLKIIIFCHKHAGCEEKIRSIAPALAFLLEHDLDVFQDMGETTGACAAQICCGVFGRDESDSEFTFTAQHIDMLLTLWTQIVRAIGVRATRTPTAETIAVADLCISDANKPLLLQNSKFLPYLVDALLLDPEHPRANMQPELLAWCQATHAECFAQLAVFPEGASHKPSFCHHLRLALM